MLSALKHTLFNIYTYSMTQSIIATFVLQKKKLMPRQSTLRRSCACLDSDLRAAVLKPLELPKAQVPDLPFAFQIHSQIAGLCIRGPWMTQATFSPIRLFHRQPGLAFSQSHESQSLIWHWTKAGVLNLPFGTSVAWDNLPLLLSLSFLTWKWE